MHWYELAENPREILSIYKVVPSLQQRRLKAIRFNDEDSITLVINDIPFPDPMPRRWQQRGYNVLHFNLSFLTLESVEVLRWSTNNLVDVHIERLSTQLLEVHALSADCHVRVQAHFFDILVYRGAQAARETR